MVRARNDISPPWEVSETTAEGRSPLTDSLIWFLSTVGLGIGIVAAIVLVVNGLL
jgi:hypothetical protein